jgi:diguanylate cyclase (GGDEF)-like protein
MEQTESSTGELIAARNRDAATQELNRHVWLLRVTGAVLLIGGWLLVSLPDFGSAYLLVNTLVLGTLGAYAFLAASHGRRISVNLEKSLRLSLLIHNVELENLAMRDDLTQLFNRRYLFERLERELETSKGFERPIAVVIIDLDCMKDVNDTFGHTVGDKLLAGFGRFLLDQARGSDVPGRIGGDEFAIILPDTTEQGAEIVITRLVAALEKADLRGDEDVSRALSASFGSSGYPWGGDTVDSIVHLADASMYAHKRLQKAEAQRLPARNGTTAIPEVFRKATEADGPPKRKAS